jgi:uncharacterized membrane protein
MIFKGGKNEALQGGRNKIWDLLPEGHRSPVVNKPAFLTFHVARVALSARRMRRRAAKNVCRHTVELPMALHRSARSSCPDRLLEPAQAASSVRNPG